MHSKEVAPAPPFPPLTSRGLPLDRTSLEPTPDADSADDSAGSRRGLDGAGTAELTAPGCSPPRRDDIDRSAVQAHRSFKGSYKPSIINA